MGYPDLSVFFGNCTTRLPFAFQFHEGDVGHTVVVGPTGKGMSAFSAGEADDEQ
ncbi:type IV secretory pathway VirB4 component [Methylocaldum sp. RMAD-M]|nr:type IV secretory pathway VirB4 component [Methylocaldum sp. RMAD-M]